ncbi:AAA family ATPase [Dietzia maris]|uniref:AAA family ATPase n=1 Tax=Dietzia maris TaxID=37915 RepID=A0AAE4QYW7_9ACTN|nr:AAA family ATPase [Dietzia maris]MDV6300919.1 AAA family ATPase [Dietzia maris]
MLRRLDIEAPWRSLDSGFWPEDLPAGCKTVIYGHNGSGKSTLSELLLSLADGSSATDVVWEDVHMKRTKVRAGGSSPSPAMAVFTRKWVEENLSAFLDGANAAAIVTLGRAAIDAKEEEGRLVGEIEKLQVQAAEAEEKRSTAAAKLEELVRSVQDQIVSQLKTFDHAHFTKNRYSSPKVQGELRSIQGEFPNSDAHAEALRQLAEGTPDQVDALPPPPNDLVATLDGLAELLTETPTRVAITALEGDPQTQAWVELGLKLHEGSEHCHFCDGILTSERRAKLARHFDESWIQIRSKAKDLREAVAREKQSLNDWLVALPPASGLTSELQPAYEQALKQVRENIDIRLTALESLESAIAVKVTDPSATPAAPDWSALATPLPTSTLTQTVSKHNDLARRHEELTAERKQTVLGHLIGLRSTEFRTIEQEVKDLADTITARRQSAELSERRLAEIRKSKFVTKPMADTLTRDLARVYGKDHLSVTVTEDGKSYSCRRGDEPGTDLSEGERTTLSLLYFLRKLEDEQQPGSEESQRIVVIDDPSSSLDREALFATHQWLIDILSGIGQYIVLTHDFSLLRLFIKSQNTAWGKSINRAKDDANEERFPKVSFLEMYAASAAGERRSKLGKLPTLLRNSTSEYAYLFAMVMAGVADSEDHERLFLLPNAARRVLEVFASYKVPHQSKFMHAMETMVQGQEGEPYRDVLDFCNRYSHGEGSETVDVLDARAVHNQIRRCMEFLQAVDTEHFQHMCKATDVDPSMFA